jgi:uncharacterized protein (UPF0264 family)
MDLLVSVRSADEARAALAGGAGLIDVKEPSHGSLGFAGARTVAAVVRAVAGRRPVSAALGELAEGNAPPREASLAYVKWGLSAQDGSDWRARLGEEASRLPAGCRPVAVAYADWRRARAPSPAEVCAFACSRHWGAFLADTWEKDGTTLLDWLGVGELGRLCGDCRGAGVKVALAGSLGEREAGVLAPLRPDWLAVRGAVCRGGRAGAVDGDAVRRLAEAVRRAAPPVPGGRGGPRAAHRHSR